MWQFSSIEYDKIHGGVRCMTTRSGLSYRSPEMSTTGGDGGEGHREGAEKSTTDVSELVRLLLEDRRVREDELGREGETRSSRNIPLQAGQGAAGDHAGDYGQDCLA